jgi:MoaD family protein
VIEVRLRLFAAAREAAGRAADVYELDDDVSLDGALDLMRSRYGPAFSEVLAVSRVWLNGDDPERGGKTALRDGDEVAVLPPVSGGAT